MKKPLILGLSASLRNFRHGGTGNDLARAVLGLDSRKQVTAFLKKHGKRKRGSEDGLSNSEAALAMALWGAAQEGADIEHVALTDHFPAGGEPTGLDQLAERVRTADGVLLSSPTYFGDRSSSAMRFIELVRSDPGLRRAVKGKVCAGLAVGAKRNGGQETTLIYQMLDLMNCGFVGVGNDSDTTSQYGGTGHAGDIGAMADDDYGLNTCLGTGRRIARVTAILDAGREFALKGGLTVGAWLLQEGGNALERLLPPLLHDSGLAPHAKTLDLTKLNIRPCNACAVCPSSIGLDHEFRCFLKKDGMRHIHEELISADVLMPVVHSPRDRAGLVSRYQEFMERTRYLRRGDYVFSDRLVVPLILEELGANENLHIRMLTSFIRHHTVMFRPIVGWLRNGEFLNREQVAEDLAEALDMGLRLTAGRLGMVTLDSKVVQYNPVGYVLGNLDESERENILARQKANAERKERLTAESRRRVEPASNTGHAR